MKLKFLYLALLITPLFAVRDLLIKPNYNNLLFKTLISNYPLELDSKLENDDYNIFLYKGHFRVIFGRDYNDSTLTRDLANNILDIANYVWDKEIEEFGFKAPRNSDKYYIDIYLANKNAYNPERGYITAPSYLCGYATAYGNKTSYFVINPKIDLRVLKVTIAHEFFHIIQYAYGFDEVNSSLFNKNRWFLESSAVMMEDEVYDDIDDYINFLSSYLSYTNYPIDYSNGKIEYGKVLFSKYIVEKYGMNKIKKIFESYETNETILDDLKKEFDFNSFMLGYAKCLANKNSCFEEGDKYPNLRYFSLDNRENVYYYGIAFINKGVSSYLNASNSEYLQEDFSGNSRKIIDVNKNGLIAINCNKKFLNTDLLMYNQFNSKLELKKGWNLVSNIFNKKFDFSQLKNVVVWVYRNGTYKAYSDIDKIQKIIKSYKLDLNSTLAYSNEGFWVYCDNDLNLTFRDENLADNNISLQKGWQIVGFSSAFTPVSLNAKIIWEYDKDWKYYMQSDENSSLKYLIPTKGYFILK